MDKRYQVFVSSTFKDLMKERSLVMDTLYKHKCLPVGMENFPSLTIDSLPYIYQLIDESDFFLLILNGVYGSSRDAEGKSFTHLEWLHALELKKPIIVLYRLDWEKHTRIGEDVNDAVAFRKFFDEVRGRHDGAKPWTPETLTALVIEGVDQAIKDHPEAVGWVRGDMLELTAQAHACTKFEEIDDRLQHEINVRANILYRLPHNNSAESLPMPITCTLKDIFLSFAKKVINYSVGEDLCIDEFCEWLTKRYRNEIEERLNERGTFCLINIEDEDIDNIRMEFMANGLAEITKRGTVFIWRVSDLGMEYLKELHNREFQNE